MLASGTEIVAALGLEDQLVGISHECDYPPELIDTLPRLSEMRFDPGDLTSTQIDQKLQEFQELDESPYEVRIDRLRRLDPDIVLSQQACEVCAVARPDVRDLVEMHNLDMEVVGLDAHKLDQVQEAIQRVGQALGHPESAQNLANMFRKRIDLVSNWTSDLAHPTVLALEWIDPPRIASTFMPEQIAAAGGVPLMSRPGRPSQEVDWEKLEGVDPDVVLLAPCGMSVAETRRTVIQHLDQLYRIAPRALEEKNLLVVDGSAYFNRTTPRLAEGVMGLGHLLHSTKVPAPHPPVGGRMSLEDWE